MLAVRCLPRASQPARRVRAPRSRPRAGPEEGPARKEPVRDADGTYVDESGLSNIWSDGGEQWRGIAIFTVFLSAFLSLGNVGAAIVLPLIYHRPITLCPQAILYGADCGKRTPELPELPEDF